VLTLLACCTCDAVHAIHALSWVAQVINVVTGGGGLQPRMTNSLPQQLVPCIQTTVIEFMVYFLDSVKCVSVHDEPDHQ
jgi:hypothetical protein